jgi:uncharacterized membrane protein YhfC
MTTISLLFRILNVVLMMGIPLGLVVILISKDRKNLRPIGIGAGGFILSQIGHIPFNTFLLMPGLKKLGIDGSAQAGIELFVLGVAVGVSAGIFEELMRFWIFRTWLSKKPSSLLPVHYGVGHGGMEAFGLGILALAVLIQVLVLGGNRALDSMPQEQAVLIRSQLEAYWDISWGYSLLGAWERLSAMAFHLGASILVYRSVQEKKSRWLVIAFLGHVLVNAFAVIAVKSLNLVLLEGILFTFAAGWLYLCWILRWIEAPDEEVFGAPSAKLLSIEPRITEERLEESRYDE